MPLKSPLTVCLDARLEDGRHGGIQQTIIGLAHGLSQLPDGDEIYCFLVPRDGAPWLQPYLGNNCRVICSRNSAPRPPVHPVGRIVHALRRRWAIWRPTVAWSDGAAEASGASLMHFTTQMAFRTRLPFLYCPHDLQHRHLPHLLTRDDLRHREYTYGAFCRRAAAVVTMTQWGGQDVVSAYGVDPQRVAVLPWASLLSLYPQPPIAEQHHIRNRLGLPLHYWFLPAKTWPHKGHLTAVSALARLRQHHGVAIPLVLSGGLTDHWPVIQAEAQRLGVDDLVISLGFLDEAALSCCYRGCTAVVYPSQFEGFGLPLVEAAQAGVPIIATDLPVLREVAGAQAQWFPLADAAALAKAMLRCLEPAATSSVPASTTWETTARRLRAWYRALAGQPLSDEDRSLRDSSSLTACARGLSTRM